MAVSEARTICCCCGTIT